MSAHFCRCDDTTTKMATKPVKLQKESPAGSAGAVNRVKEIRRRENEGFKDNRQMHYVRKARVESVR